MYGYGQPGYGVPPQQMNYGYGQPPMMPPGGYGMPPPGGYGMPPSGGYGMPGFGGFNPVPYCPKCGGTGYRYKKGRSKRCKCIKEQAKRMGRRYDFSSSDSD